jgi:hypothetical protein
MNLEILKVRENVLMIVNAMEIENVWKAIARELPERKVTIEIATVPITLTTRLWTVLGLVYALMTANATEIEDVLRENVLVGDKYIRILLELLTGFENLLSEIYFTHLNFFLNK